MHDCIHFQPLTNFKKKQTIIDLQQGPKYAFAAVFWLIVELNIVQDLPTFNKLLVNLKLIRNPNLIKIKFLRGTYYDIAFSTEIHKNLLRTRFRSCHQRCSIKKGVLRNFPKFTGKYLCQSPFLNKLSLFLGNFVKFLRTPFLQNTSQRLLLIFHNDIIKAKQ